MEVPDDKHDTLPIRHAYQRPYIYIYVICIYQLIMVYQSLLVYTY